MPLISQCTQITFSPVDELTETASSFLEEYFEVVSCNYTDDGLEQYSCYASKFNQADFAQKSAGIPLPSYKAETLKSENWLKDYTIRFNPIEVGGFYICGISEAPPAHNPQIPIEIYAATAFGSSHQTTKCCLRALNLLSQRFAPDQYLNILDVGTGTGILSIAAAKIWRNAKILAADIDEEAVAVTAQNAETNNTNRQITALSSNGYQNPAIRQNAPYDIILANILARPLIEMSQDLYNNLSIGGYCVLSGFNQSQLDWVVGEHSGQGLSLINVFEEDDWRAVIMQK